jgi:hypothetical protein
MRPTSHRPTRHCTGGWRSRTWTRLRPLTSHAQQGIVRKPDPKRGDCSVDSTIRPLGQLPVPNTVGTTRNHRLYIHDQHCRGGFEIHWNDRLFFTSGCSEIKERLTSRDAWCGMGPADLPSRANLCVTSAPIRKRAVPSSGSTPTCEGESSHANELAATGHSELVEKRLWDGPAT